MEFKIQSTFFIVMKSNQVFFDPTGMRWLVSRIILVLVICNCIVYSFLSVKSFVQIHKSDLVVSSQEYRFKEQSNYGITLDIDKQKASQFSTFQTHYESISDLNCVCGQVIKRGNEIVVSSLTFPEWEGILYFESRFKSTHIKKHLLITAEQIEHISSLYTEGDSISMIRGRFDSVFVEFPQIPLENYKTFLPKMLSQAEQVTIGINPVSYEQYAIFLQDIARSRLVSVARIDARVYSHEYAFFNTLAFLRDARRLADSFQAPLFSSIPQSSLFIREGGVKDMSSIRYIQSELERQGLTRLEYNQDDFGFYVQKPMNNTVLYTDASWYNFLQFLRRNTISIDGVRLSDLDNETDNIIPTITHFDAEAQDVRLPYAFYFHPFIERKGEGAIIRIQQGKAGERLFEKNDENSVTAISIQSFPSPYRVEYSGNVLGKMSIGFDDGPDPQFTPYILDILKEEGVHATFYVTGKNATRYPDLIHRIINEGHEIGNHTYNHEPLPNLQTDVIRQEIFETQKAIEHIAKYTPKYFRTPFNDDPYYQKVGDTRSARIAQELGLTVSEFDTDPRDWDGKDADAIVREAIQNPKSQLLLHDSGGTSRQPTVDALREIIRQYRDSGFQFVTISELDSQKQSQNSDTPKLTLQAGGITGILTQILLQSITFRTYYQFFSDSVSRMNIVFLSITFSLLLIIRILWLFKRMHAFSWRSRDMRIFTPPVSIIVPAYNEEKVIARTIHSLLNQIYPFYEIIIVDDGSTDSTRDIALSIARTHPRVKVFTKPNGGKAMALNVGISLARYEFIAMIDADTQIEKTALRRMMRHFIKDDVGAVAGNIQVGNDYFTQRAHGNTQARFNILTIIQRLEYIVGQNVFREAFEYANIITVVSGALGVYRKKAIREVGGVSSDTLAEDGNLSFDVLKQGWVIKYERNALSFTEAPESISMFYKQRFRWGFGTLQVLWKNRSIFLNPRYDFLGFIALPFSLIGVLGVLVSPLMFLYTLWRYGEQVFIARAGVTEALMTIVQQNHAIEWWLGYLLVEYIFIYFALALDPSKNRYPLMFFVPLQGILMNTFLCYILVRISISILQGRMHGWGHLTRVGSVSLAEKPLQAQAVHTF